MVIVTTIITPLLLKLVYKANPSEPQDAQETLYEGIVNIEDQRDHY